MAGHKISEEMQINSKQKEIDVQNLLPGVYILKIDFENGKNNSYKIIRQ